MKIGYGKTLLILLNISKFPGEIFYRISNIALNKIEFYVKQVHIKHDLHLFWQFTSVVQCHSTKTIIQY